MAASPAKRRPFGFWICLALVVGNMIGSGVYLIPATLAPFGWAGVFGWLLTIAGAICLAFVFGRLSSAFPKAGGPYAYTREAFGPFAGFLVAWIYWVSLWIGNVAVATGVVAPLGTLMPAIAAHSAAATLAIIWFLTLVNCLGARLTGGIQLVTTVLKFLPLLAVILLASLVLGRQGIAALPPLRAEQLAFTGPTGIAAAAALTLWAFLGLESATIPAERVENPRRTIFRATLVGTAVTGALYLFACSAVALLLPPDQAARSGAPLADFVALHWGAGAGGLLALFAAVTAFGALNGWILLQGEMPWAMAKDGTLPRWLAATSRRGTPVRAHVVSSLLLSLVLLTNASRSTIDLFKFLVLLATTASLVPYLVCALAALALGARARMSAGLLLPPVAALAALYSAWAIWGAGWEANKWGIGLLASGIPVYLLMRRNPRAGEAVEEQG
ncbi:MAG TPA: amino acid permease [Allosphingosinicella sp.]|jgi:APA family basic amino acid/polyamine antiporter